MRCNTIRHNALVVVVAMMVTSVWTLRLCQYQHTHKHSHSQLPSVSFSICISLFYFPFSHSDSCPSRTRTPRQIGRYDTFAAGLWNLGLIGVWSRKPLFDGSRDEEDPTQDSKRPGLLRGHERAGPSDNDLPQWWQRETYLPLASTFCGDGMSGGKRDRSSGRQKCDYPYTCI